MRRIALLAVAVLGFAGCSSGSTSSAGTEPSSAASTVASTTTAAVEVTTTVAPTTTPTPTSTQAPTTTEAPTSTLDPLTAGQITYFSITTESNAALTALDAQYGSISRSEAKAYCLAVGQIEEKLAHDLKAATWPPDVQDEIDTLVNALAAEVGHLYDCADDAVSNSEALNRYNAINWTPGSDAASAARLALNLPIDR